jgi:hypothetical protein
MRRIISLFIISGLAVMLSGCKSGGDENAANKQVESGAESSGPANSAGGLTWIAPSGWKMGPPQQMRAVTYVILPVEGDVDNAELAVFHFPGSGGDRESNLQRWMGQFEQPDGRNSADVAVIKETKVNGLKITTIDLKGIYSVTGGPMMEVKEKKTGYALKGAIVEGPQGLVFFKMIGPEKTVEAGGGQFTALLSSIRAARA